MNETIVIFVHPTTSAASTIPATSVTNTPPATSVTLATSTFPAT
jgi:hypothetical protein